MIIYNLPPSQDNIRFNYLRCKKNDSDYFELIKLPIGKEELEFLKQEFDEVLEREGTLPGYRLCYVSDF